MTKEQILEKHLPHSWYTPVYPKNSHPIHDKDCLTCKVEDDIFNAMQEYADQELSKERERSDKLYKVLKHINFGIDLAASHNANYVIETADVNLIKQSLTEYKK